MKKRLDFWDIILRVMYTFIGTGVVIGIIIAMRVYVVDQFAIPTDSMRPTLIPGDINCFLGYNLFRTFLQFFVQAACTVTLCF